MGMRLPVVVETLDVTTVRVTAKWTAYGERMECWAICDWNAGPFWAEISIEFDPDISTLDIVHPGGSVARSFITRPVLT